MGFKGVSHGFHPDRAGSAPLQALGHPEGNSETTSRLASDVSELTGTQDPSRNVGLIGVPGAVGAARRPLG